MIQPEITKIKRTTKSQLSFISCERAIIGAMLEWNMSTGQLAINNAEPDPNYYIISTGLNGIAKMNTIVVSLILRMTMDKDGWFWRTNSQ